MFGAVMGNSQPSATRPGYFLPMGLFHDNRIYHLSYRPLSVALLNYPPPPSHSRNTSPRVSASYVLYEPPYRVHLGAMKRKFHWFILDTPIPRPQYERTNLFHILVENIFPYGVKWREEAYSPSIIIPLDIKIKRIKIKTSQRDKDERI